MTKMKSLILDYDYASVEYIGVKGFQIKYPYITVDGKKINLCDVKFVKYKNFIAWKNRRKK
jgi:hypothetical protein|nr:MAG TPA: hypothetical protein [Caudoviricetes sp.]